MTVDSAVSKLALPPWLTKQRAIILIGGAAILAGSALNWGWLTAVGAAPILLALLPCAAMCALGLCMKGSSKNTCSAGSASIAEPPRPGEQQQRPQ